MWSNFWKWIKRWERDHKQYDIRKRVRTLWGIYSLMIFRFCLFAHKNTTESIQIHTSMPKYLKLPSAGHSFQHWNLPLGLGDNLSDSRTRSELSLKHPTYMNQTEKTNILQTYRLWAENSSTEEIKQYYFSNNQIFNL